MATKGIRLHATFTFSGELDKMMANFTEMIRATRKEKGCKHYELFKKVNSDGGNEFAMIEHWENQEALSNHMKTAHMKVTLL